MTYKSDGTRLIIDKQDTITLWNRHNVNYTRRLPDVVEATENISGTFTLDTEAVYINPKTGKEEFTPCQRRCATQDWTKIYYLQRKLPITAKAFDLLQLDGKNLEQLPWIERKRLLWNLLGHEDYEGGPIQYVPHRFDLADYWEEVKQREGEGLILKDVNSPYVHDRSYKWLKLKNWRHKICHVVGYTPGKNARASFFGSLVLTENDKFVGCAGSGPNDWELRQLKDLFADCLEIPRPFDIGEPYIAVDTDLTVQVKYYQITENGVMRFPIFEKIVGSNPTHFFGV